MFPLFCEMYILNKTGEGIVIHIIDVLWYNHFNSNEGCLLAVDAGA